MKKVCAVVMAAGKGTRMKSAVPKVLHRVAGAPMIEYVLAAASSLHPRTTTIVVGHGAQTLRSALSSKAELCRAFEVEISGQEPGWHPLINRLSRHPVLWRLALVRSLGIRRAFA